jgi:hypothetical protein
MTKRIVIPYFPKAMKYATPLLFGTAVYLILIERPVWASILVLLGIIILTTNYVTEINLRERSLDDYLLLLWLRLSRERKRFKSLDRIIISKSNYSQTLNSRIQTRQIDWTDFTGTLLLDNDTIDLVTHTDKKKLLHTLREFSDFLKVDVEDRTTNAPYWIDMSKY